MDIFVLMAFGCGLLYVVRRSNELGSQVKSQQEQIKKLARYVNNIEQTGGLGDK